MLLLSEIQVTRILGTYTEEYQRSRNDRLPMKKYMGVWSRVSAQIREIRVMFPRRLMT
ncbi:Solute Carrier Family 17 Member 9 [Manis pentadactyla]|nr:Solute Carrier Family 17 Member 9 [Manis pentadactyla]